MRKTKYTRILSKLT